MRTFYFAANWKLNKNPNETKEFVSELSKNDLNKGEVVIFPSAFCASALAESLEGTKVKWGPQNCYFENSGAFTGENSALVASQMGALYVLIGHSERRQLFGEDDKTLAKKVQVVQELGLTPMLCVGETLEQRESGDTNEVINKQLEVGLSLISQGKTFTIAYEPVWAIGTGQVATPEQAESAHAVLRAKLSDLCGKDIAAQTSILYGGSVKPDNAGVLSIQPNVDGFLIGGASLKADSFFEVIKNSQING